LLHFRERLCDGSAPRLLANSAALFCGRHGLQPKHETCLDPARSERGHRSSRRCRCLASANAYREVYLELRGSGARAAGTLRSRRGHGRAGGQFDGEVADPGGTGTALEHNWSPRPASWRGARPAGQPPPVSDWTWTRSRTRGPAVTQEEGVSLSWAHPFEWVDGHDVLAMAYGVPIPGFRPLGCRRRPQASSRLQ
jgi:hypothetical protein